jgi:hypothetical protein
MKNQGYYNDDFNTFRKSITKITLKQDVYCINDKYIF